MNAYHTPVLLHEAVGTLVVKKGNLYVDATLGGGGHTEAILQRGGIVLGIDQDQSALDFVAENLKTYIKDGKLTLEKGNFKDIKSISDKHEVRGKVAGILYDFGVSSFQIDKSGKGFSIKREEPLDMRMGSETKLNAYDIVNHWNESELAEIFSRFGEEDYSNEIARAITTRRQFKKIETSLDLATVIKEQIGRKGGDMHPATKAFMALRIVVNDELGAIQDGLWGGFETLETNGRMVVISFHSLEDRITKKIFQELERAGFAQLVVKKPIVPTEDETHKNRRSRSAKLRAIEKI